MILKKDKYVSLVLLTTLTVVSCLNAPSTPGNAYATVIDYKGKDLGVSIPSWISKDPQELEKEQEFKGLRTFVWLGCQIARNMAI